MLFPPPMAYLLARSAASGRPQAPTAPRSPRRGLLHGLRSPRRRRPAVAAGRLLLRPQRSQSR